MNLFTEVRLLLLSCIEWGCSRWQASPSLHWSMLPLSFSWRRPCTAYSSFQESTCLPPVSSSALHGHRLSYMSSSKDGWIPPLNRKWWASKSAQSKQAEQSICIYNRYFILLPLFLRMLSAPSDSLAYNWISMRPSLRIRNSLKQQI